MKQVYFDNNATTMMPQAVIEALVKYSNCGNLSSHHNSSMEAEKIVNSFKHKLENSLGMKVIFTSCASESNATVFNNVCNYFKNPHVIISAVEHKSISQCAAELEKNNKLSLSIVPVNKKCQVNVDDVIRLINENTRLVSIMGANNETGSINDIDEIFKTIKSLHPNIITHSDIVQLYGKGFNLSKYADFYSISFHKLYGPTGIGLLAYNPSMFGNTLPFPLIYGTQNDGNRGGTYNLNAICATAVAHYINFTDRNEKNLRVLALKNYFISKLFSIYPCINYSEGTLTEYSKYFVVLTPKQNSLYNTILFSTIIRVNNENIVCNKKLIDALEANNIAVSSGSACNTGGTEGSVLVAMEIPDYIKKGILRISFSDYTTKAEIDYFIKIFKQLLD